MMSLTIALIADIHGNLAAFDAVLDALKAEPPDQIVCLGDVAATGPQPREVLQRLHELGCPIVMGNADAELLDVSPPGSETDEESRRIADISRWCAAQLDDADRAFLASFQPTVEIPLGEERRLLCCHGSPRSYDDVIVAVIPDDELDAMIGGYGATVRSPVGTRTSECFAPTGAGRSSTLVASGSPISSSRTGACACRRGPSSPCSPRQTGER